MSRAARAGELEAVLDLVGILKEEALTEVAGNLNRMAHFLETGLCSLPGGHSGEHFAACPCSRPNAVLLSLLPSGMSFPTSGVTLGTSDNAEVKRLLCSWAGSMCPLAV